MNLNFKHQRSFSIGILILLGMLATLSFKKPYQQQPPKDLTVTLNLQEWNMAVYSITNPDDVTANQKKEITNKIILQLNKQLADTTKPKK